MAVQATNYDGTREYSVAEIEDVHYPNLLVNGDFKCNQRGKVVYDFSLKSGYTLDMWYSRKVKVTPPKSHSDSVKLDNTNLDKQVFKQRVYLRNSKKYTIATYVTQITGMVNISLEQDGTKYTKLKALTSGKNEITFDAPVNSETSELWLCIEMDGNSSVGLNYIDMFFGAIVYSHKEEDYIFALKRCQQFLKCYQDRLIFVASVDSDSPNTCETVIETLMTKVKPTAILHGNPSVYGTGGANTIVSASLTYASLSSGRFLVRFEAEKRKNIGQGRSNAVVLGSTGVSLELTCEPL